jgi:hypothetical protein
LSTSPNEASVELRNNKTYLEEELSQSNKTSEENQRKVYYQDENVLGRRYDCYQMKMEVRQSALDHIPDAIEVNTSSAFPRQFRSRNLKHLSTITDVSAIVESLLSYIVCSYNSKTI